METDALIKLIISIYINSIYIEMEIHYIGATWCKACHAVKPAVKELAAQASLVLVERDYDKDFTEEGQAAIRKLPTIRVIENSVIQAEFTTTSAADSLKIYLQSKKLLPEEVF
jgi:thiol-disulfide isomerase/thioredoxin